jgi:hypothetical protein
MIYNFWLHKKPLAENGYFLNFSIALMNKRMSYSIKIQLVLIKVIYEITHYHIIFLPLRCQ